jgi:type II restriction enzyme
MEGRFTYCNTVFLYKSEKDVCLQLPRPAVKQNNVIIKYLLFSELRSHCDALCKFGESHHIMEKIARAV